MADINTTVGILFQGTDSASAAINSVNASLKNVGDSAQAANPKLDEMAAKWENGQVRAQLLAKQAKETALALDQSGESAKNTASTTDFLTAAMSRLATAFAVKEFIDANVQMQNFERTMTLLKGSSGEAATEFKFLTDISNNLGLNVFDASKAFISLTAATQGTKLEGQATKDIFEAVARAMASLGKSSADTTSAFQAITQIVSKGTVSMEELRGQLGERLPGAMQIAARAMNLTTAELVKLVSSGTLTAEEFLPKLAAALDETFGNTGRIESFSAELGRLQTNLDLTFIAIGKTGIFDKFTSSVGIGGKALETLAGGAVYLTDTVKAFYGVLTGGSLDDFNKELQRAEAGFNRVSESVGGPLNQSLAETDRLLRQNSGSVEAARESFENYSNEGRNNLQTLTIATKEIDGALKALGLDPKKFKNDINEIFLAFKTLAENPNVTGEQFLAGFEATLKRVTSNDQINQIGGALTAAFLKGEIGAAEFSKEVALLGRKQEELNTAFGTTTQSSKAQTDAIKKQADETKRAEENAAKMALELEKLASNERIKTIEFAFNLKIADIEATTKRVEAAFTSIDSTIKVTTENTAKLFELFASSAGFLTGSQLREITDQIDKENDLRERAFQLQQRLVETQIDNLRAQTENLSRGDAIIKIDGAGLQPQLEAFMWEILRAIQVRVNSDGLKLLLGMP